MDRTEQFNRFYLQVALLAAGLSYAKRRKVGCTIVKDRNILAYGYNGTPAGMINACEDDNNETKEEVIHAEVNAIIKAGIECKNAYIYCTFSPCLNCAKLIIQAGIIKVFYGEEHSDLSGLNLLVKNNIYVERI